MFWQSPASLVETRGDRICAYHLWKCLVGAYSLWQRCGRPSITDYHFEMELEREQQWLSLQAAHGVLWAFAN